MQGQKAGIRMSPLLSGGEDLLSFLLTVIPEDAYNNVTSLISAIGIRMRRRFYSRMDLFMYKNCKFNRYLIKMKNSYREIYKIINSDPCHTNPKPLKKR